MGPPISSEHSLLARKNPSAGGVDRVPWPLSTASLATVPAADGLVGHGSGAIAPQRGRGSEEDWRYGRNHDERERSWVPPRPGLGARHASSLSSPRRSPYLLPRAASVYLARSLNPRPSARQGLWRSGFACNAASTGTQSPRSAGASSSGLSPVGRLWRPADSYRVSGNVRGSAPRGFETQGLRP